MILDILRPSSGAIEVLGGPPGREKAAEIGFLPEERGLYRGMSAFQTIVYFGATERSVALGRPKRSRAPHRAIWAG